ncbi:aspartyl/asparaginyl beta-hydroxylase domain-containing protein [Methylobacterium trifolii]|uniref:aspartyl/asparaginyl beta-hydroxylase domain-containing protein n=1 Tax=Methylobacterium trifolii TaxID=1003092 RepID=UPI001EDF5F31|nr:aspartyl/asparaginyl beta-hydroxylase domain-containing protein [Methylobacterium trifolii]
MHDATPMTAIPDRLRLPLRFDAEVLAAECAALGDTAWIAHFVTRNYAGDWDVIPLRAQAGATHPVMMIHSDPGCRDYADTPFFAACPALRAALAQFRCPLEAVRLMRLGPDSTIREHRDHDLAFEEGMVRIHVPILTHPGVVFTLNRRRVVMEAGSAWYLRLSEPHAVENPGPGARVHLVVDARVDPWIAVLFAAALAEAA